MVGDRVPCIMGDLTTVIFHYAESLGEEGMRAEQRGCFHSWISKGPFLQRKEVCILEEMNFL